MRACNVWISIHTIRYGLIGKNKADDNHVLG